MSIKLPKARATTEELATVYPWHFGGAIPSTGPVLGVDRLAGGSPLGIDPLQLVIDGFATNPNMVIAGAPGNGKSSFVKSMIWYLVGAHGWRFVATDVKGEYRGLAEALDVPVLDLRPGGDTRINPLEFEEGRLEFVNALASLCVDRSLETVEKALLAAAVRELPAAPILSDLIAILRDPPESLLADLVIGRDEALTASQALRYGLGDLLSGSFAGMFDGESTIEIRDNGRGFVVDVSGCEGDEALRFAMLAAQRFVARMLASSKHPTIRIYEEGWRQAGTREGVKLLQHDFKLGRQDALVNILVVHRFSEIGAQADGHVGEIAKKLVADADIRVMFRQGESADVEDCVTRLKLPISTQDALMSLPKHRALIEIRGRLAVLETVLSPRLLDLTDTNSAVRVDPRKVSENAA